MIKKCPFVLHVPNETPAVRGYLNVIASRVWRFMNKHPESLPKIENVTVVADNNNNMDFYKEMASFFI